MPLQYSIEEQNPAVKYHPEYYIVPQEVAETNEHGCYALFNNDGEKVSPWCLINRKVITEKASTRNSVKDAIEQTVTVGDYVGYNNSGGNSPISIGRVVGFTNKQVRVLAMSTYHSAYSKLMYESSLIKLPEEFWTGAL